MHRLWLICGALAGLLTVALAAWASHAAPRSLAAAELAMLGTVVQMLGWHGAALLAIGLLAERRGRVVHVAAALILSGLALFCGAVLWRVFTGVSLGPVAPAGGVLLMAGWAGLALALLRR
jgi:uncharacterized membrane protein YgdD (TMEM256/DUF423 family)